MLSVSAAKALAEPRLIRTLRRVLVGATGTRPSRGRIHPIDIDKDPKLRQYSRTEIVSEKLCDDLIAYLSPTLKAYQGCTILDIHPGACLWSTKLHEYLRPKCHILMEPDDLYTQDFIKPLVEKANSKYFHSPLPFLAPNGWTYTHPYAQALEDARAEFRSRKIPSLSPSSRRYDDVRLRLVDGRILVTGNLSRLYPKKQPHLLFMKEMLAALDNTGLHRNGVIRMLWWLPDTFKNRVSISPQVLTGRSSTSVMNALAADITQVVGVDTSSTRPPASGTKSAMSNSRARNAQIDAENKHQVTLRMHTAGMFLPEGRQSLNAQQETFGEDAEGEVRPKNPFIIQHHTVEDVGNAISDFDAHLDRIRAASKANWDQPVVDSLIEEIEYPQCLSAAIAHAPTLSQRQADHLTSLTQRKAIYLDTMLRMINLETHVVVLREKGLSITELQSRLHKLDDEITRKLMKPVHDMCITLVEDQQIHFSSPQNLMYDRRTYEPLLASSSEFWPNAPLALYDCIPTDADLDVEDIAQRQEGLKLAHELSKILYQLKASPLPVALDRAAPNAAQDLIPKVPCLTDPRRGGRLDPKNVVMRMVSERMFEELVRAWFEWPFKPESWELELSAIGDRVLVDPTAELGSGTKM